MSLHTLPDWLSYQAAEQPQATAIRHKQLGIWQQLNWSELHQQVGKAAQLLKAHGFGAGDTLYLLSFPRPEAITLSLAAQWLGGISAPLDPSHSLVRTQALLRVLAPVYLFAEAKAQVDIALNTGKSAQPESSSYRLIVYADQRGLSGYQQDVLRSYAHIQQSPSVLDVQTAIAKPQDEAFRFYRLSEYSVADGTELQSPELRSSQLQSLEFQSLVHQDMLNHGRQLIAAESLTRKEEALAARAFAASGHARYLLAPWLIAGFKLNFPEKIETRDQDRRELGPTLVAGTKATFMRLQAQVQDRLPLPGTAWRKLVDWGLATDTRAFFLRRWLAQLIVLRPLRDVLGFSRTRVPLLVGEPLPAASAAFFHTLGVQVRNWPDVTDWQASAVSGQGSSSASGANRKSNKYKANTYKAVVESTACAKTSAGVVGSTLRRLRAGLPDALGNIGRPA